jgi:hemoglobin
MVMSEVSLYTRLGGYDALAAAVDDLLVRVRADELLGRFWRSPRSDATNNRERQLTLDFMVAATGGPVFYTGRDMKMAPDGMGITTADYAAFVTCVNATLDAFGVPETERNEANTLIVGLEAEVVADNSAYAALA